MKFLAVLVAALLAFSTPAEAAQKRVAVKKIEKIAVTPAAELLVANGSSIITISNLDSTISTTTLFKVANVFEGAVGMLFSI